MNSCSPLTELFNRKKDSLVVGFDIETYGEYNKFLCCTFSYSNISYDTFKTKDDSITHLQQKRFLNARVVATNLGFDLFGLVDSEMRGYIRPLFRGGKLIMAFIYQEDDGTWSIEKTKNKLVFLDTLCYLPASVDSLGKILDFPKLESPKFLGKKPKDEEEWEELLVYNERDASISREFLEFLELGFIKENTKLKYTIAATSMDNWRRNHLKDIIYQPTKENLLEQLKAYYGGRTETFKRGKIVNANYYDFNSLYPSVMVYKYPHPNSYHRIATGTLHNIEHLEGLSEVVIECPNINIPLLPVRDTKIIFPKGIIKGWYSHIELRKALEIGYVIHFIGIQHYYLKTFYPFKEYVTHNYNKRLEAKKKNNNMQLLYKLLMNSLYGKFAQKFEEQENFIHINGVKYDSLVNYEIVGDWVKIVEENDKIPCFVQPIFSIYVTSYARIKLYEALMQCDPIYCDTDSIITKDEFPTSNKLGALKLECKVKSGIIVRPKFYNLIKVVDGKEVEDYRIKGLMKTGLDFNTILSKLEKGEKIGYTRFVKFRQSIRSKDHHKLGKLSINQILIVEKYLGVEDDKRIWKEKFNRNELQDSLPLDYNNI